MARESFPRVRALVASGGYDLVVLDELNCAVDFGLVELEAVKQSHCTPNWSSRTAMLIPTLSNLPTWLPKCARSSTITMPVSRHGRGLNHKGNSTAVICPGSLNLY